MSDSRAWSSDQEWKIQDLPPLAMTSPCGLRVTVMVLRTNRATQRVLVRVLDLTWSEENLLWIAGGSLHFDMPWVAVNHYLVVVALGPRRVRTLPSSL